MSSDDGYRHYQIRWLRIIARAIYIGFGLISVVIVLGNAYDARRCAGCGSPVVAAVFLGPFWLVFVVATEMVTIKTGLEECEDGYIVRRNYGSSRLRLQDVARFEHTYAYWPIVVAVRRDGARIPVPGLVEGYRTVWDGGQTYHIVDTLNERQQARLARADAAYVVRSTQPDDDATPG